MNEPLFYDETTSGSSSHEQHNTPLFLSGKRAAVLVRNSQRQRRMVAKAYPIISR